MSIRPDSFADLDDEHRIERRADQERQAENGHNGINAAFSEHIVRTDPGVGQIISNRKPLHDISITIMCSVEHTNDIVPRKNKVLLVPWHSERNSVFRTTKSVNQV